jgi:hypothetical protein
MRALFILAFAAFVAAPAQQATQAPEKNVLDWYLDVPNKYLQMNRDSNGKAVTGEARRTMIRTQDISNGYLAISDPDLVNHYAVALFRRRAAEPFLGITIDGVSVQRVLFVERTATGWREITKQVLPKVPGDFILAKYNAAFAGKRSFSAEDFDRLVHTGVRYQLPRRGTALTAVAGIDEYGIYGEKLFELTFDGERFSR